MGEQIPDYVKYWNMYLDEIRKDEDTEKTFFLTLENIIKIPVDKKTT